MDFSKKFTLVSFHCDECGEDTYVANTNIEKEMNNDYHCVMCGNNKKKSFYLYDDFYVKKVD